MGKRKFTAEQAREALLTTGVEMLQSVGPAGVATVSLAEAINRSGVPRPSAYRVFGGGELDPQTAFQEQLVLRVIEMDPGVDQAQMRAAVAPILEEAESADGPQTEDELTDLLKHLLRTVAERVMAFVMHDPGYGVYLSAMALVRTGAGSEPIEAAIAEQRTRVNESWQPFYRDLMSAFGLRLRLGWDDAHLAMVFTDATTGAVMAAKSSTGESSQHRAATCLAATYFALTALATEQDSRRVVSAQPLGMLNVSPGELVATA